MRQVAPSPPCSGCSTSGRHTVPYVLGHGRGRPSVRALARAHKKLTGGGKALLTSAPAPDTIITDYPKELEEVAVGTSTLASTDSDTAGDAIPDVELLSPDTIEAESLSTSSVDEENPYTDADALR